MQRQPPQPRRRGDVRKIDTSLGLGLHELGNSGKGRCRPDSSFRFQLRFARQQAEDVLLNLDNLVKNTVGKIPMRRDKFGLDRETAPNLTDEEDKWERAMFLKWGPQGSGEYVQVCKRIQTYQYPLRGFLKDRCWGPIDLLGIGRDFLPVPNELKRRKTSDSPLRMLVEVAAYGFAILGVWPTLKDHWGKGLCWLGAPPSPFPATLDRVTLVGVAPEEYWSRYLGRLSGTDAGVFPFEAWPPFWHLVDALQKWFDIYFVAIQGTWDDTKNLPTITGAHVLDRLRFETLNPAAANPTDSAGTNPNDPSGS